MLDYNPHTHWMVLALMRYDADDEWCDDILYFYVHNIILNVFEFLLWDYLISQYLLVCFRHKKRIIQFFLERNFSCCWSVFWICTRSKNKFVSIVKFFTQSWRIFPSNRHIRSRLLQIWQPLIYLHKPMRDAGIPRLSPKYPPVDISQY